MPFISLVLLFFMMFAGIQASALHTLHSISALERKELEVFFRNLFYYDLFAYTLYGDKPMSISDYSLMDPSQQELLKILPLDQCCEEIMLEYSEPAKYLQQRWQLWKKYSHHLKIEKYVLIEKSILSRPRLLLINKDAFIQVVNENLDLFRDVFGPNFIAANLLDRITHENTDLREILHDHQGLLGILLGFGRHNSMLFYEKDKIQKQLKMHKLNLKKAWRLQKKLETIQIHMTHFHPHDVYRIASTNRVQFFADPYHHETILLRNKYDELNKKILEISAKEDWFEQTIKQLLENDS